MLLVISVNQHHQPGVPRSIYCTTITRLYTAMLNARTLFLRSADFSLTRSIAFTAA